AHLVDEAYAGPLHRFGMELGYAFQIADDVLDYRATDTEIGKRHGQDLREGKMTLPLILACEAHAGLHATVLEALQAGPPMADAAVSLILRQVVATGAAEEAMQLAREHARNAIECLQALPDRKSVV